jgi:hypothetical protein
MATIGETIDLHVPLPVARQKWNEYVTGMVIGSGLGPHEREYPVRWHREERDAEAGAVQFAAIDDQTTRLTVTLEYQQDEGDKTASARSERLRAEVRDDLDLFGRYAEGRLRKAS